jgi:hypothetical protein
MNLHTGWGGRAPLPEERHAVPLRLAFYLLGKERPMAAGYACGDQHGLGLPTFRIINMRELNDKV